MTRLSGLIIALILLVGVLLYRNKPIRHIDWPNSPALSFPNEFNSEYLGKVRYEHYDIINNDSDGLGWQIGYYIYCEDNSNLNGQTLKIDVHPDWQILKVEPFLTDFYENGNYISGRAEDVYLQTDFMLILEYNKQSFTIQNKANLPLIGIKLLVYVIPADAKLP